MGDHVDVIVVGAGISGISAAYHLQRDCPDRTYAVVEGRPDLGGTWDLFRYPGVRSDSDMHTLGFSFKPWIHDKSIADGPSILAYLNETVDQFDIRRHIRFGLRVVSADWSSDDARWTVTMKSADNDAPLQMTCSFLYCGAGYYRYDAGYTPELPGLGDFRGTVVHPQQWPVDLDYHAKRVVVIGSGATAMTLVPAMANDAALVTMVQRSPTYVVAAPDRDALANGLRKVLPDHVAYRFTRWKNTRLQQFFYQRSRVKPAAVKAKVLEGTVKALGADYVAQHFTPSYGVWDERLCLIPNGDLYAAINAGRAAVVTGTIDSITATGVRMANGDHIDADIIVTATGLQMSTLGGIALSVDGALVDIADTWTYKGFGYSGVPNLASVFGYVNASWTLRADLCSAYLCRLLNHMRATRTDACTPTLRRSDEAMPARPWIDGFNPGYVARSMSLFPKQGDRAPWVNPQNFKSDRRMFLHDPIDDGAMQFSRARRTSPVV